MRNYTPVKFINEMAHIAGNPTLPADTSINVLMAKAAELDENMAHKADYAKRVQKALNTDNVFIKAFHSLRTHGSNVPFSPNLARKLDIAEFFGRWIHAPYGIPSDDFRAALAFSDEEVKTLADTFGNNLLAIAVRILELNEYLENKPMNNRMQPQPFFQPTFQPQPMFNQNQMQQPFFQPQDHFNPLASQPDMGIPNMSLTRPSHGLETTPVMEIALVNAFIALLHLRCLHEQCIATRTDRCTFRISSDEETSLAIVKSLRANPEFENICIIHHRDANLFQIVIKDSFSVI